MQFTADDSRLHIELDCKQCELQAADIAGIETRLHPLKLVTKDFPLSNLHITVVRRPRTNDYRLKTTLRLPSRMLFTGDHHESVLTAFDRCVRKLIKKVGSLHDGLNSKPEYTKVQEGTMQDIVPTREPLIEEIENTIQESDYAAFRSKMAVYEDEITRRVGRWIQRYPDAEAKLGETFVLSEIVEEVFLNAFELFEERPKIRLGEWLENLIDQSIRAFIEHPEEEKEAVSFAQTVAEMGSEKTAPPSA